MSGIIKSIDIDAPIDVVFDAISDFESYPGFLEGMKKVKVLEKKSNHQKVEFTLDLFKRIVYMLDVTLSRPNDISWELIEADSMKRNDGGWRLKDIGSNRTNAEYRIDIDFKIWIPGPISNFLVNTSIPSTLKSFKEKSESIYKGGKGKKKT
jgi:ribosome-associated toxin RatA of RatAB toxin-antitoxin module